MELVFIRLITFFGSLNMIFPSGTPNMLKVAFSLLMSVIVAFTVDIDISITNSYELIIFTIMETLTGLILGYMTNICFNSLRIGGSLIDQQLGLAMANIYDPNTKEQNTLIENIIYWVGVMIFFGMNGHHLLIDRIIHSFELVPVGTYILDNNFNYIINVFIQYFIIGFKIAVPMILSIILSDLILGLISRSVPQLNVMIIGMSLKVLVGIIIFLVALPFIMNEIQELLHKMIDVLDGTLAIGPIGLILSTGDKTEEPTGKKLKDARKKGNVAKSKEVTTAITLVGILLIMYTMSDFILAELQNNLTSLLTLDFNTPIDSNFLTVLALKFISSFMKIFLPVGMVIMALGIIGNLIQSGLLLTGEGLKPQLSKLNPLSGFKNMFSMKALGQLVKSLAIVIVLFYIGYLFIEENFQGMIKSQDIHLPYLIHTILDIVKKLFTNVCLATVVIAAIDFAYQKYTYKKDLKMTKQEVKEEYKQMEGDPHIKGKIKQKQREIASRRMMQEVPSATVILTNPTHLSIAIRYERGKDSTPIVVAKGQDLVALKIREIAKEHDIPIIENKPLARLIYKEVEINEEIPENMYQAVAEILVAVYKIKNRYKKI